MFKRAFDDLAHVNGRVIDGTLLLHLIRDDPVALVEKQDAELFALGKSHGGAAIVEHALPRLRDRAFGDLALQHGERGGAHQLELVHHCFADARQLP